MAGVLRGGRRAYGWPSPRVSTDGPAYFDHTPSPAALCVIVYRANIGNGVSLAGVQGPSYFLGIHGRSVFVCPAIE